MSLFLFEIDISGFDQAVVAGALAVAEDRLIAGGGRLLEAQATADRRRLYAVAEASDGKEAEATFSHAGLRPALRKQVRLVGQDPGPGGTRRPVNFLVEWDLPAGLTMEDYLRRKAEKTPLYAQVPEVRFERTYVCEDMAKCLCFYDGPDEAAVRRAREVVGAPVNRLAPISALPPAPGIPASAGVSNELGKG